ncbi:hypothetical protein L1987_65370 [Smallanthus sonchifolius]|uniref:Uncharacterized protein n=1 Tax=Smallanthus sonchifolius TaxID=185202 RepID=A0ACB9BUD2_9ASTR|nr:hypothetical protein L1987_65370 [Smallanthus sonchifolius]
MATLPISIPHRVSTTAFGLRPRLGFNKRYRIWKGKNKYRNFFLESSLTSGEDNSTKDEVTLVKSNSNGMAVLQHQISRLQQTLISLPPVVFLVKNSPSSTFMLGFCIATTVLIVAVRVYVARKLRYKRPGSVADLVRRGQLNSDRRGISKPVMYDDPFNNPQVKISKNNSTVEMCGKVYKLAPVTLTREEQDIHQKRRSRAYQWKRPTIFLKEGDPIPSDVDPDTVRWIPANHPFATTINDITEDLAQKNVYQKHGVPFRIQAEHEALQKKLEALQSDQKLKNLVIDPGSARNFERPFKSNPKLDDEQSSTNGQSQSDSHGSSTCDEKQTL